MGDTVVFEDEITPAMDAAFAHGLGVTALHNYMADGIPCYYFLHYWGSGRPEDLARGLRAALDRQQ